jgi:16S rRNA (cytidine1402-2'-O)-methyltransferase
VVATPLGNLRDLGLRALDVLASADVIGAEDTRVTTVLLRHYGIATRPVSIREHNESRRAIEVIEWLRRSQLPWSCRHTGRQRPGALRAAGLPVVLIPAPAVIAAVSAVGLRPSVPVLGFAAGGACPARAGSASPRCPPARNLLRGPHRVRAQATGIRGARASWSSPELTKKFESITCLPRRGGGVFDPTPTASAASSCGHPGHLTPPASAPGQDVRQLLRALVEELPPARAARVAAVATGLPRAELYALAVALKGAPD